MPDNTIYFPYVRVPESDWFSRVLLYWDEVGAIIPYEILSQPNQLGAYTNELVAANLVRPVEPERYINQIPNFREAFLHLVDNNEAIQERRQNSLDSQSTFRIHLDKLEGLPDELVGRNLAQYGNYPWFEVETLTGEFFMAYLASVLGKHPDLKMVPITDAPQALSIFTETPQESLSPQLLIERMRVGVLEEMLPAPAEPVPVGELVSFKEDNAESLQRFRRHIESQLIDISAIPEPESRQERLDYLKVDLAESLEEIVARMREKNWPRILFGAMATLTASAIPAVAAAVAIDPRAGFLAVPGLVAAIYGAMGQSSGQIDLNSPLAYAALTQRKFAN